jgi:hypothetical protein
VVSGSSGGAVHIWSVSGPLGNAAGAARGGMALYGVGAAAWGRHSGVVRDLAAAGLAMLQTLNSRGKTHGKRMSGCGGLC